MTKSEELAEHWLHDKPLFPCTRRRWCMYPDGHTGDCVPIVCGLLDRKLRETLLELILPDEH